MLGMVTQSRIDIRRDQYIPSALRFGDRLMHAIAPEIGVP